jgi:DNA-binding NarL/FixJ family response regulator
VSNPWGLRPRQFEVMQVLTRTGCNKMVARELGISVRTLEQHLMACRKAMGAPNRAMALLAFDRAQRVSGLEAR